MINSTIIEKLKHDGIITALDKKEILEYIMNKESNINPNDESEKLKSEITDLNSRLEKNKESIRKLNLTMVNNIKELKTIKKEFQDLSKIDNLYETVYSVERCCMFCPFANDDDLFNSCSKDVKDNNDLEHCDVEIREFKLTPEEYLRCKLFETKIFKTRDEAVKYANSKVVDGCIDRDIFNLT